MKHLLSYINPSHAFDDRHGRYAQIQIDNSLLYWPRGDTILVTNFPFEYNGVKALQVADDFYCDFDDKASKVNVIIYLLENKILDDVTWFHDLEAWQVSPFDNINLAKDLGLTSYGWKPKWNTGSFFFKPSSLDMFYWLREKMYHRQANEEPVLWDLHRENFNNIQARCQGLNITYNLGRRHVESNLAIADKPVRVAHFHPYYRKDRLEKFKSLGLLPDSLVKLIEDNAPHKYPT